MLPLFLACGVQCGEGTHLDGKVCVADGETGAEETGDGDTGAPDLETGSDSDTALEDTSDDTSEDTSGGEETASETGSGDDTETGETAASVDQVALLVYANSTADCSAAVSAAGAYTYGPYGSSVQSYYAEANATHPAVAALFPVDGEFRLDISASLSGSGTCNGASGTSNQYLGPASAGSFLEVSYEPGRMDFGLRVPGLDFDGDRLRVRFDDGIDPSYAEYVLGAWPVLIVTTVGSAPPQYILEASTPGASAVVAAELLLGEPDVDWARPEAL